MNKEVYNELNKQFPAYFEGGRISEKIDSDYYEGIFKGRELYIWGIGKTTKMLLKKIPNLNICAFVDSYCKKERIKIENEEHPVVLPNEMKENVFCIVSSIYYDEIKDTLERMGKTEGIDFLPYKVLFPTPTEMIEQMLLSERITGWECEYHSGTRRLQRDGSLGFCMNTPWQTPPNGNVFIQSYEEICSSVKNKLIQISIEKGLYCFCNKNRCSPLRESIEKKKRVNRNGTVSKVNCAIAAFDRTCNLHCESCRNEKIVQSDLKVKYLNNFFVDELLPAADIINCAGEGEALFSKAYLNIFEECKDKNKKIMVLSNGTLANKEKVDYLTRISNGNLVFSVSIDAAKKETYESLRRGANYDVLMENMRYIGRLAKGRKIRSLVFNYVISKKNWNEIPDFIHMAKEIGVSAVNFTLLGNWGTFTEEEYKLIRVTDDEFNPLPELKKYMDEIIQSYKGIKIFFRQEYDFRNYINQQFE